jgi:ABC-type branched-subunit amino acid transport system permease subunit
MSLDLSTINWLAVIVGTIIYFALGALWYSPALFAKPWQRSIGWDPAQQPPQQNPMTYVVPFFAYLIMAIGMALLAGATGSDTFGEGVVLGLVVGVGFAAMHSVVDATFDPNRPQPWTWFAITASYNLIGLLVLAVIVSIW